MENQKKIEELSETEIKAFLYDQIILMQQIQTNINL